VCVCVYREIRFDRFFNLYKILVLRQDKCELKNAVFKIYKSKSTVVLFKKKKQFILVLNRVYMNPLFINHKSKFSLC